jgi:methyl-accepting chemotaxis protein
LHEAALDQVQSLQRDHELAFLAGIAGTVLGVVVQITLTPNTADKTFLIGVVVKGCSTFVGVMVALYARDMRQRLLDDYDLLVENLVRYASFYLAPHFIEITADRAAVSEVLRRTIEDLKQTVERVKTNLSEALALAVESASKDLGKKLKETFATELSEAIKEQITKPFQAEVERLKTAISQSGESIAAGVRGLNEGTREFKQEAHKLSQASNGMGGQLAEASNVLKFLTQKFEEIVGHADLVSQKLKESQGELALAIERTQNNHASNNGDDRMMAAMEKMLEDGRKDRQVHAEMIDRLVGGNRK